MDADTSTGLIYLPPGRYRIASTLTLRKPLFAESGAVLVVDGVTLTLLAQPEAPRVRLFEIRGKGRVTFGADTIRTYPEWWGAKGDGRTDDSAAVQAAFNAAADSGSAMLYLTVTYGIGKELTFTNGATVMSEPSARFVAVQGNPRGLTFIKGGFAFKNVLPHLSGFGDFCIRFFGSDLGSFQLQTLANCGDAIRLEAQPDSSSSPDWNTVLDNTVWFDTITNSRFGVAIRAANNCQTDKCIYQGNQILGNAINGCAGSGTTGAVGFFYGSKPSPAWDANQFNFGAVNPCKGNSQYAMLYASPETETQREIFKVGSVGAVPPGAKLFSGYHIVLQASLNLREPQPDGAGRLRGLASLVEFSGKTTPPPGAPPVRAANKPNSKGSFNGGRSLLGNYFTIQAVPDSDWPAGESRTVYVYHQMATGELYHVKCDAPRQAGSNLPIVSCTQAQDNSKGPGGTQGVTDELMLTLINLTGRAIPAGTTNVYFNLAVATLGSP